MAGGQAVMLPVQGAEEQEGIAPTSRQLPSRTRRMMLGAGAVLLAFAGAAVVLLLVHRPSAPPSGSASAVLRGRGALEELAGKIEVGPPPSDDGGLVQMQKDADTLRQHSLALKEAAEVMTKSVKRDKENIMTVLQTAEDYRNRAEQHRKKALEKLALAKQVEEEAVRAKAVAAQHQEEARVRVEKAARLMRDGRDMESRVDEILAQAHAAEENAREEVYFFRLCVDMPGVRLKGTEPQDFAPILPTNEDDLSTSEKCQTRCQKHSSCRQAVFSAARKCELFHGATIEPTEFSISYNTSYCGALESKYDMMDMVRVVLNTKPESFGDPAKEIAQADVGASVTGTSLFCFAVVLAVDTEVVMADHIKQAQLSVCECDEYTFVNAPQRRHGSNIEPFIQAWDLVGKEGHWKMHDWTIKVDPDAVFFASRMKVHIQALRTPAGEAVYIRNGASKYHLVGPVEALTRGAMSMMVWRYDTCRMHVPRNIGEDEWLEWCLEHTGVDYQTDLNIISSAPSGDCGDASVVAFPFYNTTRKWGDCHSQAKEA